MKAALSLLFLSIPAFCTAQPVSKTSSGYPIKPVSFTQVKVGSGFWGERLRASREVTIPLAFSKCEETGRYDNFIKASHPSDDYVVGGFPFDDTDVYKTIEGASYLLQTYPDKRMEEYIDSVLNIVRLGQEADGYLNTAFTMNPKHPHEWHGTKRWERVEELSHELYNLGHMLEGAVAHYQATGKRNFLDIAQRYADCVCREIGPAADQIQVVPGHQIAEMGLCKLYLATGNKKYLDEAKFFLDYRGRTKQRAWYNQSLQPVTEQREAIGHAVRATYQYAGMADVACLTGDTKYITAIDSIWKNIVDKKLYITGGIGSRHDGEAFGDNYELPNATAYCETCAAIGNVYVNYRLFLLHGESKYYDVLERTLYNGLISGISMDGGHFFYPNPLNVSAQLGYERQPWFGCACCPSNACRFITSLPGYIYAVKDDNVYVNLFMNNTADVMVNGKNVSLEQSTGYPWNGDVKLSVKKASAGEFALKVRIPGWVRNQVIPSDLYTYSDSDTLSYSITVNGEKTEAALENGYATITKKWKNGDVVEIHFDMLPRTVVANEKVKDDAGRLCVECGPIVYCAEWPDNSADVNTYLVQQHPALKMEWEGDLLGGVNTITTDAQTLSYDANERLIVKDASLKLIPYYAWAHRGKGAMTVWLPCRVEAASAQPEELATWKTNGFFNK